MSIVEIIPHGLCKGVNTAIVKALKLRDVYCLHALVHNEIIVQELKDLGYRFVDSVNDVPRGGTVVFSAHGVPPAVRAAARARGLKTIDFTCPYVAKAHAVARAASAAGRDVVVLGDCDHAEVKGILGEITTSAKGGPLTVVCQTTLDRETARREVARLASLRGCGVEDVEVSWPCAATQERQEAVRAFCRAGGARAVLVLGSRTSANARRLREVAAACGAATFAAGTLDEVRAIRDALARFETVGVTSGASTPERFYREAVRILNSLPRHVAFVMDGNGRWATARGKTRGAGHVAGAKTLTQVLRWCGARQIPYVSVYAFSTENWTRPSAEVNGLMKLFETMMKTKAATFVREKVRFRVIGRRGDLSPSLQKTIAALEKKTAAFERQLIVCLSYGGRAEIVDAANRAIARGERVTEETFRQFLYAPDVPDPDLVIRTSGERRTSNFLLWESAYAEYHFTETLWPDFSEADLDAALADYATRHRRKGGVA